MSDFKLNVDMVEWQVRVAAEKEKDPIAQIIQGAIAASCTIIVHSDSKEWTGSGFHIGHGLIVTASHVAPPELMQQPSEIVITFDGKTPYQAQVVQSEEDFDCALLYSPQIATLIEPVQLGDSETLEVGDLIAVIGSPEGWHDTATVGRISNVHQGLGPAAPSAAWNDIIFIDADILQGVSGGMVIATDGLVYGSVMGVAGAHADLGIGEHAVCPSNKIKVLVQRLSQPQTP